jgi:hypothetical protein
MWANISCCSIAESLTSEHPAEGGRFHVRSTIHSDWKSMANTKSLSKEDRKKARRAARKKATPKAKRTAPRGSLKRKVKKMVRGTAKR